MQDGNEPARSIRRRHGGIACEVVVDDDLDQVTPLNLLYYVATQWQKAIDEVKAGDMGKRRMMEASQRYAKAPNFGSYDRKTAYTHLRKLAREAIGVIHG